MIVLKFGGTSVAGVDGMRRVVDIVAREGNRRRTVVISAIAGVTDRLLALAANARSGDVDGVMVDWKQVREEHQELAHRLFASHAQVHDDLERSLAEIFGRCDTLLRGMTARAECTAHQRDEIIATGEDMCAQIVVAAFRASGYPAQWVDARSILRTTSDFGRAQPLVDAIADAVAREVMPRLAGSIVVVQGFIGADAAGRTTTLGRGGSDTTAGLLGAALRAEEIQIWTDVDGVLTADPRVVPDAMVVSEIGFEEAIELSYFGAKVLHPPAAKHAAAAKVPLRVLNTFNPSAPGTLVRPDARAGTGVAAIAYRGGTALVTVRSLPMFMAHGFLARVFDVVARRQLAIDLIATSHTSTSFTVAETGALEQALEELRPFCEIVIEHGFATMSVIGQGLLTQLGIAGRVFGALGGMEVRLITQASDVSLNFLVAEAAAPECARRLHDALIGPRTAISGEGLPDEATGRFSGPGT